MAAQPTIPHDHNGRRIIRNQVDREWLYDQIFELNPAPTDTLGDIKQALNVNCAGVDIIIGLEIAYKKRNPKGVDAS